MIITENVRTGLQYRLSVSETRNRQWFAHYGEEGAGFGYLTWTMQRQVGRDWPDLGYGFPVWLRKGPFRTLFYGQIVRIDERTGDSGDQIEVWASGWVHVANAEIYNYIYCDTRLNMWERAEVESGSFQPDKFDTDTSERVYLKPRRSVDFEADDYTRLRYTFQFGEVATRLTADYDLALPEDWPGKLEVRDSTGAILWSATATASGSIDVSTSGSPTYFEVRFYVTTAGENTADSDAVYGKFTDVKVYSVSDDPVDGKVIADDLAALLSTAGHGLSSSTVHIASTGRALEPATFDRDMTAASVLAWCCKFGDSNGNPLAWGVTFDDHARLFLEPVDLTTIGYVVTARDVNLSRGGDWGDTAQVAYGIYMDEDGVVQRTDDQESTTVIAKLGGYYRRIPISLSGVTDATMADNAVALWLAENAQPGDIGSFTMHGGITTPNGRRMLFDEILPGSLVQIREWRALEATLAAADYRDQTTTFLLAGVRVDEDARTVELIPRTARDVFARYMAIIQELAT